VANWVVRILRNQGSANVRGNISPAIAGTSANALRTTLWQIIVITRDDGCGVDI
jgi:hypothetical protein